MKKASQPKVSFLLANLKHGGIQEVTIRLSRAMLQKGYAVDILILNQQGGISKEIPRGSVLVDFEVTNKLKLLPKLVGYIWRERPRALISNQPHLNVIAILANLLAARKTKVIACEHSDPQMAYKFRVQRRRRVRTPILESIFYSRADAIVAVSEGVADAIASLTGVPRDTIHVIYNPVVDDNLTRKAAKKADWPFDQPGHVRILAVGRLNPAKDYLTLINAFGIFQEQHKDAQLLILGDGETREQIEDLVVQLGLEQKVLLFGYTDNPYAFMSISDVLVSSSVWEGFSMVIAEALACGAQVVATDCPSGPAEILAGGKYGWLVPVRDPEAMAKAMAEALRYPHPKAVLRERAALYSVERAAEAYSKLLS